MKQNDKIKPKVGFFLRLKFAYHAFTLQDFEHVFPYQYHCNLISGVDCDNIRRSSKCKNPGVVALANPSIVVKINESNWFYHVCGDCAKKYEGSMHGEE